MDVSNDSPQALLGDATFGHYGAFFRARGFEGAEVYPNVHRITGKLPVMLVFIACL